MTKQKETVKSVKTREELLQEMMNNMSAEQKAVMFPPIERKNFVVRKSWYGRNQIITFTNNKGVTLSYDHDKILDVMRPRLDISPCWIKRGYWSQSTDLPMTVRHLATVVE